ncbi:GH12 family glycosyl hydrolase domain-containing protein [Sphingomonas sp. ID0503]|uniref:GH12 family glycosyl hydrolase domain-containing protein n=1 Tax=Sphingomonas sp. ID0503 TaxID=3399691 RepID=UPI003AFA0614
MYINASGKTLDLSGKSSTTMSASTGNQYRLGTDRNDLFHSVNGDIMAGGLGDDSYNFWSSSAKAVENAGEGIDTAYAYFWGTATLDDNIENLVLKSAGSTAGIGNSLNNILMAGDVGALLDGKAGDDVLVGGIGADIYRVAAGEGSNAIYNFQSGWDSVQLQGYKFASFANLMKGAQQVGDDVAITLSKNETLLIHDTDLAGVKAEDFGFQSVAPLAAGFKALEGAGKAVNFNGWYVLNNIYNPGALKQGTDFTVSSSYSPTDMTKGTTFNWSFPATTDKGATIKGYPEVIFGVPPLGANKANPTDKAAVFPVQLKTLTDITLDHDVSFKGNTGGFNVAYDIWLTDKPNGGRDSVTNEVMIWVHKGAVAPYGKPVGTFTDNGVTYSIYNKDSYTAFVADEDVPKGSINLDNFFAKMIDMGLMSSDEYLASVELGAEIVGGTGSLTINDLDISVSSRGDDGVIVNKLVTGAGTTVTHSLHDADIGSTMLYDDHGLAIGTKVTSADGKGGLTVESRSDKGILLSSDSVTVDSAGVKSITHYDADGVKTGLDKIITKANGAVHTQSYDAAGKLIGVETVSQMTDKITQVQHYGSDWKFTGGDNIVVKDGFNQIQHYDANWKFTGGENVVVKNGVTQTQFYDAKWKFLGADNVTVKGAVAETQHYDTAWKFAGADRVKLGADGSVSTEHFDKAWTFLGREVVTKNAAGWSAEASYDGKSKLLDTLYTGTTKGEVINGSSAPNEFHGGLGSDTLKGGAGADTFHFDTKIGNGDVDTLLGFVTKQDSIVLHQDIFTKVGLGKLDSTAFVAGTQALDANDRIIYDKASGDIFYDADGAGGKAAVHFAEVAPNTILNASDFLIVA